MEIRYYRDPRFRARLSAPPQISPQLPTPAVPAARPPPKPSIPEPPTKGDLDRAVERFLESLQEQ